MSGKDDKFTRDLIGFLAQLSRTRPLCGTIVSVTTVPANSVERRLGIQSAMPVFLDSGKSIAGAIFEARIGPQQKFEEGNEVRFNWAIDSLTSGDPHGVDTQPILVASDVARITRYEHEQLELVQLVKIVEAISLVKKQYEDLLASVDSEVKRRTKNAIDTRLHEVFIDVEKQVETRMAALRQGIDDQRAELETNRQTLDDRELRVKTREDLHEQKSRQFAALARIFEPYLKVEDREPPNDTAKPIVKVPLDTWFERWPTTLRSAKHLVPKAHEALVQSFLLSLLTAWYEGGLVLLNGGVGTGKTRIVEIAAGILAGRTRASFVIPVRPGWLDATDLLGFYNPVDGSFQPTPFATALVEAGRRSQHQLHLICLDELNLARIENYGADVLSRLEYAAKPSFGDAVSLPLYSRDIGNNRIQKAQDKGDSVTAAEVNNIFRYPPDLPIPANVVLLGTLNSDETTYEISPKVIDRCFAVTFPSPVFEDELETSASDSVLYGLDLNELRGIIDATKGKVAGDAWKLVCMIDSKYLRRGIGIPLSHRSRLHFEAFSAVATAVGLSDSKLIAGHFIMSKVLPRVRFSKTAKTPDDKGDGLSDLFQSMLKDVGKLCDQLDSAGTLRMMHRQLDDQNRQLVRYFGADL